MSVRVLRVYTVAVPDRLRVYHPRYPVSWFDRIMDLFGGVEPPERCESVDYTLVDRGTVRALRGILDGMLHISLLGAEMVRADTTWTLPASPSTRREVGEEMVRRLKFEQIQLTGARLETAIRWVQFEDAPHGSRVLIRLVTAPNMGLRSVLAGNVGVDSIDWEEVAVG